MIGFIYSGVRYIYCKDVFGNITAILDENENVVVKYDYDAWGNHRVLNGAGAVITDTQHIGHKNPFRYRGYYYDTETGLYYLKSRYYDPETCRFINMDSVEYADPSYLHGLNLYAYCNNNPIKNAFTFNNVHINNIGTNGRSFSATQSRLDNGFNVNKTSSTFNWVNSVMMTHFKTSLINNNIVGGLVGNISYTATTQLNSAGLFYSFANVGNSGSSYGVGLNLGNVLGLSAYVSSDKGIGVNTQITPWATFGGEVSLREGITISGGAIIDDTTHEISVNIGWATIAATAACVVASTFIPGSKILAGLIFLVGLFG